MADELIDTLARIAARIRDRGGISGGDEAWLTTNLDAVVERLRGSVGAEALTNARADVAHAMAEIASVTAERDAARDERDAAWRELADAQANIAAEITERDTARAERDAARVHVSTLTQGLALMQGRVSS